MPFRLAGEITPLWPVVSFIDLSGSFAFECIRCHQYDGIALTPRGKNRQSMRGRRIPKLAATSAGTEVHIAISAT